MSDNDDTPPSQRLTDAIAAIHHFEPTTPRVMPAIDPVEASFLAALQASPNDDETRTVYADWLEERGQTIKAEFLGLQIKLARITDTSTPEAIVISNRLRAISPASDAWWRALTSRPAIEKCEVRFEFKCPKKWSSLTLLNEPTVRYCGTCDRRVHFCASLVEVVEHGAAQDCVAFDASLLRDEANEAYDRASEDDGVMGLIEPDSR
jgi:uncharacterized protein (TIGR02996 family)